MARYIHLEPHLSADALAGRYRATKDPVERSRWHFLWLLARGLTATVIAGITGYSAYWIGRIARRYNQHGPDGVKDLRHQARPGRRLLTAAQQDELLVVLARPAPQHDRWNGRTVVEWIAHHLERPVCRQLGWIYLRRLGARLRVPRPRHVHADSQAQADFKQRLRPLLRAVATAFPQVASTAARLRCRAAARAVAPDSAIAVRDHLLLRAVPAGGLGHRSKPPH